MGFFRQQEENLALRYLAWQYKKANIPFPHVAQMRKRSAKIVDDAHRIARERGGNVVAIARELIEDIKKEGSSEK